VIKTSKMKDEKIKKQIEELIKKTTFQVESVSFFYSEDDETLWYSIKTNEPQLLIGRNGEVLIALNHLIRRIIEKNNPPEKNQERKNISIDVNDYQKKRIENLKTIAHMMAERAKFFKSKVEIDPMPSFERLIIHRFLATRPEIKTESTGEGKERRIVIKYVSKD